jgi:glycosyltransferase involved in cell wall biosynthesis
MPGITHLITNLSTGGAEYALYNLLNGGLHPRFENIVISLMEEETIGPLIRALQVPVVALGMHRGRPSLAALRKLRRLVREIEPDIIQGWMYHGNAAAILARHFVSGRTSLVWNVRQSLYDIAQDKPMTRQIIRANRFLSHIPEAILYNSHLSRKQHEAFGFGAANGQVIPNGIDVDRFVFARDVRARSRSELGIPPGAKVVGHIARLHPMKDHAGYLGAATQVADRCPEVHFILAGRGVCPEAEEFAALVPRRLHDRFHLLGERADIPALMNAMDIFCLSSAWGEGFPNVLGEAMATELVCVATDIGDSAIIVGDTGVIVPPKDTRSLAAGIESLVSLSHDNLRLRGVEAKKRIERNYKSRSIVERYAALYENLLSEKELS